MENPTWTPSVIKVIIAGLGQNLSQNWCSNSERDKMDVHSKLQLPVFIAGLIFVNMKTGTTIHQKEGRGRERGRGKRSRREWERKKVSINCFQSKLFFKVPFTFMEKVRLPIKTCLFP